MRLRQQRQDDVTALAISVAPARLLIVAESTRRSSRMRLRRRDEVTALTIYASAMKTYWNCLIPRGAAPIMRICMSCWS
jgi:hypothetical protein